MHKKYRILGTCMQSDTLSKGSTVSGRDLADLLICLIYLSNENTDAKDKEVRLTPDRLQIFYLKNPFYDHKIYKTIMRVTLYPWKYPHIRTTLAIYHNTCS